MAYRIELDELPGEALRRILHEEVSRCRDRLDGRTPEPKAVHDTRRSLKRVRALLRLMRSGLGDRFATENVRYRDIGRLLSGQRDQHVLLETLDLLEQAHGLVDDPAFHLVRQLARAAGNEAVPQGVQPGGILLTARRRLKTGAEAISSLAVEPDDLEVVLDGLETTLRRCRSGFDRAVESERGADWHELRKSVQQHWRQMRLVSRAWSTFYKARGDAAAELSQILGQAQDLAVLQTFLHSTACQAIGESVTGPLSDLAAHSVRQLHGAARPLGLRLLAESPRGLSRRTKIYWHAAAEIAATRAVTEGKPG